MMTAQRAKVQVWPVLAWDEWKDTAATLHMWTQIVGKTRLELTPLLNHWWNVPLYVTARGLSTAAMPYQGHLLEIEFDFLQHRLDARMSDGSSASMELRAQSVAAFYHEYLDLLKSLGVEVNINPMPVELADPISFPEDDHNAAYDKEAVNRFWTILRNVDTALAVFRSRFQGKSSPVHFFWGSFDLAVTRFSGKAAPARPDADKITQEAYSHEVISAGFWPGNGGFGTPAFYCYAAPEPPGLKAKRIEPAEAFYSPELSEFLLRYDDVRQSQAPEQALLAFLQSSYDAAADLAHWDRASLERPIREAV